MREHLFNFLLLEGDILFRGCDEERVGLFAQHGRDALRNLGEEGMDEAGDDESHGLSFAGDERAGGEVGAVVELLHPLEHALAGVGADVAVIAEYFGNRHNGDAEVPCDILHPDGHC